MERNRACISTGNAHEMRCLPIGASVASRFHSHCLWKCSHNNSRRCLVQCTISVLQVRCGSFTAQRHHSSVSVKDSIRKPLLLIIPQQLLIPEEKGFLQVSSYIFGASCPAWLPPLCSIRAPRDCQEYPNPSVARFPPAFLEIHPFW